MDTSDAFDRNLQVARAQAFAYRNERRSQQSEELRRKQTQRKQELDKRRTSSATSETRYAPERQKRLPTVHKVTRDVIIPTSRHGPLPGTKPSEFKGSMTPDWYARAKVINERTFKRSQQQDLSDIGRIVSNCLDPDRQATPQHTKDISELRNEIHRIEFLPFLPDGRGVYIKKSRVLDRLREIVRDESNVFPRDVICDARVLRDRWWEGNFEPDLLRGIKTSTGTVKDKKKVPAAYALQPDWEWRKDAKQVGDNGLCVGQWWPLRICALRDGCHNEIEAGISGEKGKGVFAIMIADGGYKNEQSTADESGSSNDGDVIWYCGTESKDEFPTRSTTLMLESYRDYPDQPIRVLRGASKFPCAPSVGIRYDGLYQIIGHELVNVSTAMYRFHMKRIEGQDPIRAEGVMARPNEYEIEENKRLKLYVREYVAL